MNLRLPAATETALKAEAARTGRSQQEIIREALDRMLGLATFGAQSNVDPLILSGVMRPPTPYRSVMPHLTLPEGVTTLDLLEREDRF